MYIADNSNHRVRKVTISTGVISTIAGTGITGFSGDGGAATSATLNGPIGVALDSAGLIYLSIFYSIYFSFMLNKATCTSLIVIITVSAR